MTRHNYSLFSAGNPYTKEMKREIKKLQSEIDTLKRDIENPPNDESILSGTSTIQAPLQPTGPIGEVIAELKAHNNAKQVRGYLCVSVCVSLGVSTSVFQFLTGTFLSIQ